MKTLRRVALALAAGAMGLALGGAAAGSTSKSRPKIRHIQGRIEALALDGSRIAYDVGPQGVANKVLVWNVSTGKTTTVSGKHTRSADDSSTGSGVIQLAIAGSRVAWLVNVGGNTEGDDYLYSSSVTKPKEREVATEQRLGESCPGRSQTNCAGQWLGGLVASGNLIALNRWTTDAAGSVIDGGLYVLSGTTMKTVANGGITVEAASADGGRVAVLHPGIGVVVYSSAGMFLLTVSVPSAAATALGGHNLAVLTTTRQLEIWDTRTAKLRKTFAVAGSPKQPPGNLDVQGNIAIYATGPSLHAVNLSSGKDRAIGKLRGSVAFAHVSSAGVVYSTGRFRSKGTLVFLPFARVAAAVSG